jgi:hypothetical protein
VTPALRDRLVYSLAVLFGLAPLWSTGQLPMVDLPQHLHLISALHRLDDPTTLYPQLLEARGQLTPYLGYYYLVSLLHWLLPLELANRLFLSASVAAVPLSLAFLLEGLGRPRWPSLLALPFAYGDSFAWGFVNSCAAMPLAFTCCGLLVRTLSAEDTARRRRWAVLLGLCLVLVLLFHVQPFAWLGLALPVLLVLTPARPGARRAAVLAALPGVLLFLVWVVARTGEPAPVEQGAPWKAWGPMLSSQNLAFKPFDQNAQELWLVLANALRDGSDRAALWGVVAVALAGLAAGAREVGQGLRAPRAAASWLAMLGLAAAALALFFLLPFDIRGYVYYLNTRYAHLAAALLVAALPAGPRAPRPFLLWGAAAAVAVYGLVLARGYARFGDESRDLRELARLTTSRPRVMGLIFQAGSAVVSHPVYLHAACELARTGGGIANFSFALTPHSPLRYRAEPPPTFPSEWQPGQLDYERQGRFYDHFLLRGARPEQVFGQRLGSELTVTGQSGGFWLVRRR